ncbi:MAG TPA: toll/interleukin-1 receptor domain-containing protein [Devosiaceae bacterium]|jgi:hypothetical protein|nr:toll/interleukin-1 receptor domain-containing protein [Devosiaceae bacterium]
MSDHKVFISFSSRDRQSAEQICQRLEQGGLRCWVSFRDVGPGENYQEAIVSAIQGAKVFVLVFSPNSNDSQEVHKEVSLASFYKSHVIPVRIVDIAPKGALAYELATRQWVDAFSVWDGALEHLVAAARRASGMSEPVATAAVQPASQPAPSREEVPVAAAPMTSPIFSRDELESTRAALAVYLGPIADVLVRKAANEARSVNDLHKRLAMHIPKPDEQAAFQQKVRRQF